MTQRVALFLTKEMLERYLTTRPTPAPTREHPSDERERPEGQREAHPQGDTLRPHGLRPE